MELTALQAIARNFSDAQVCPRYTHVELLADENCRVLRPTSR